MSLFSMLGSAASSMTVFENAMAITQNNVANASTPGYAKQIATFEAQPLDLATGNLGGVQSGPEVDTRSQYAEASVRDATTQLGTYEQQVNSLTPLQSQFDITGKSGIPAALSSLYSAFSTWATNPGNASAQQNIITQSQNVAAAFNTTSSNVAQTTTDTNNQISSLVDNVNTLVGQLSGLNAQIAGGDKSDPGLEASVTSTLQSLSEVANITTSTEPDGAVDVMLGSQTMLLSGTNQNKLSVTYAVPKTPTPANPLGPPDAKLVDSSGTDVTANATGGQLGGILSVRNQVLPSIQGSGSQDGSLNQLAKGFADQVNTLIGFPLFTYNATDATNTAASLQVSPSITTTTTQVTSLTGTPITGQIDLTNATNTLNLQVDGKTVPPITVSTNDHSTLEVVADLNSQFGPRGIGANASMNSSGELVLSTTNLGSNGSIAIENGTANADLNLTQLTPTYKTNTVSSGISIQNLPTAQVAALTGTVLTSPITLTANTNTLNLQVDGKTLPAIMLNSADASAVSVATDLNAKFSSLGIDANASVNASGSLILATTNTGSNGSIAILNGTANATLGLTQTTPTYQNGANSIALSLANLANSSSSGQVTGLTGTTISSSLTITPATNDALNLAIDGKTWPITLNSADAGAASVAADLNAQFAAKGIGASAKVSSNGGLSLSTTNTGSTGSIALLSGSANTMLGLTTTTPSYQNGLDGQSFTGYFGSIASLVGTAVANAQAGQTAQQDVVTQAQTLRQQISGVDLNAEAATLLQFQNSYEAASKMVSIINSLTTTVLNLIGSPVG